MTTVSQLSERYVEGLAALDPSAAARGMGLAIHSPALRDYSPEGTEQLADFYRRMAGELATCAPAGESERLGILYLRGAVRGELDVIEQGESDRDLSVINGPAAMVRLSFDLVDPSTNEEWDAVLRRLDAVPSALAGYRRSLGEGLRGGRAGSRRCAEAVAEQCSAWSGGGRGGWFAAFAAARAGSPVGRALEGAAARADAAYGELADFLRREYLPGAAPSDGVGGERYGAFARRALGADLDAAEAYEFGAEELLRLQRAQARECDRIAPGAGQHAVLELLASDPARRVAGVDAWRGWLQERTDAAIDALDGRHFDIAAPLRTCVVTIPPEGGAAAPYYTPPSDDLGAPGRIWFPLRGETSFPTWDAVTTVYHEAVPGHHLQLGALRLVPLLRAHRLGFAGAHGEGWALYAERLMDELGMLELPEYRLGFLAAQAMRAARVVIDIGLHTGMRIPPGQANAGERWSYGRAVDALRAASGRSEDFCRSEVVRYLGWPAQATSYKLGERVWLEGRELARRRAGGVLDLKDWHARALALGPLWLDDLAAELGRLAGRAD